MSRRKRKAAEVYDPAKGTAAAQAKARAAERRRQKAAAHYLHGIRRAQLLLAARLCDYARAAAESIAPGCDGAAPEVVDAPMPGENPQLRVSRNIREHPLELMAHKRQISVDQYAAGEIFRRDLELSQISPMSGRQFESIYTTELSNAKALKQAGVEEVLGPKTFSARRVKQRLRWEDLRPAQLDAMDRVNKARRYIERVAGREAAEIVAHLCRDRLTVQEIAASGRFGHRNRVGRRMQAGLDALADHFGTRPRRRGGIRSWGDGDHKPTDTSVPEAAE